MRVLARAAFTLIEIVMVVALIGIVVGFAVSRVNFIGYRMDANIRLLQNALIGAQQTAITRNVNVHVMFDAANQRVRILQDADGDDEVSASEEVIYRALDGASFMTPATTIDGSLVYYVTGSGDVGITPLGRAVRFTPNGALSGDVVVYIGFSAARPDDMRALAITGATARTTFWSHASGAWRVRAY